MSIRLLSQLVLLCLLAPIVAVGQHPDRREYPASNIPIDALDAGDAVVRFESQHFDVDGIGKAVLSVREVVTVLNEDGRELGYNHVVYDDLRKLKSFKGWIYDAEWNQIGRVSKDNSIDMSAIDGQTLYASHRVRAHALEYDQYPYTVVTEYELGFDGLINWPSWSPQRTNVFVERSRYQIDVPETIEFRVLADGLEDDRKTFRSGDRISHLWRRENQMPVVIEPLGPTPRRQVPTLLVAPKHFEIEGSTGLMETWEGFGNWYHTLSDGRDQIPDAEQAEILEMVDGMDLRKKTRTLYQYMQDRTRYVSVQLGLGGWQPFDALYVNDRGYGDCKALTNYMFTLLKIAGVEAYPALISSGEERLIYEDFPCNQFNHVILYVPTDSEPIWLECTSQTLPFGELTWTTEDRPALVVKPLGSELIRTPASRAKDNRKETVASIVVSMDGSAHADVILAYAGNQQDAVRAAMAHSSDREKVELIRGLIELPSFDVEEVDVSEMVERTVEMKVPVKLEVPGYASASGKRLFLKPNMFQRWTFVPEASEGERKQDIYLSYARLETDSLSFKIPDGFVVEAPFKSVELDESFGSFSASVSLDADGIMRYTRRLEISQTTIPAMEYDSVREFFRQIAKSDGSQMVFVRR